MTSSICLKKAMPASAFSMERMTNCVLLRYSSLLTRTFGLGWARMARDCWNTPSLSKQLRDRSYNTFRRNHLGWNRRKY
jgi:hypothetical protein